MEGQRSQESDYRVWIDDGMLFMEFSGELSLKSVLKAEEDALLLLTKQKINVAPVVVLADKIQSGKIKVAIGDFAKLIAVHATIKHISAILVVGSNKEAKKKMDLFNKIFFSGRIKTFDKLEDALVVAKASRSLATPILEQ